MKKQLLPFLFSMAFFAVCVNAQISFSDDFESYNDGDLIAQSSADWTTWGGGGTSDDSNVSAEQAFSGVNSLEFYSASGGGPADVILPFGGKHEFGTFHLGMQMYVESGTGAYFNFQGEETVGQEWTLQMYFLGAGEIQVGNSDNALAGSGTYPYDEWFSITVDVDLTNNIWRVGLNGTNIAQFANPNNTLASMDLYPTFTGGASHFYVDDVEFSYDPPILPDWDAAVKTANMRPLGLTGQIQEVGGVIRNLGINTINSFDITFSDGTTDVTESYSGLDIPSLLEYEFTHPALHTFIDGGSSISLTVSNINNGEIDGNDLNNTLTTNVTGYTPHADKKVLIEEATGTWCTWCPRGAVFMGLMAERYPDHFVGVAVHNGDPMAVAEYDAGMTSLPGFTGFPSVTMERRTIFDPSNIEQNMLPRLTEAPLARVTNVVTDFNSTGEMLITVQAEFLEDVSGNFRFNAIIIENGVTGVGSGYNQINAYSGGGNGPMGGYENLPNPVPFTQMVYDEVGRALLGGYAGAANSLPTSISAGEIHEYTFSYVLGAGVDPANMEVIGVLMEPNGTVNNVAKTGPEDFLSSTDEEFRNDLAEVYPNPFSNELNIRLALAEATNVEMTIFNAMGQVVANRSYGKLAGNQVLRFNANDQATGIYYVHIQTDEFLISKKVQLIK
jgi:hypothetical protein